MKIIQFLIVVLLCIVSAYIAVTLPISEKGIPFTAQSLVIFVIAGLSAPGFFLAVISTYLFLGALGLPVFAEGSAGVEKLFGPSGGFLFGFLVSGILISFLTYEKNRKMGETIGVMLLGTAVLFICGVGMLAYKFGLEKGLAYGYYPFWKMGLVKAILSGIVVCVIRHNVVQEDLIKD